MKYLLTACLLLSTSITQAQNDERELDGISITGNQELPKALFIVPWQDPRAGIVPSRPFNSVLNTGLTPVDPREFRRSLKYYDAFHRTE